MLYVEHCGVGNTIEVYVSGNGLAGWQNTTNSIIKATYLGYYPNNRDSGDKCLLAWRARPPIESFATSVPSALQLAPQISNPFDYFFFRWVGSNRYVHADLGHDGIAIVPGVKPKLSQLKPGELSPIHEPGWHQCKCGFRNQDISISAFIGGKYVCYSCRNIWKK